MKTKYERAVSREMREVLNKWGVFIRSILSGAGDLVTVMRRDIYINTNGESTLSPRKQ